MFALFPMASFCQALGSRCQLSMFVLIVTCFPNVPHSLGSILATILDKRALALVDLSIQGAWHLSTGDRIQRDGGIALRSDRLRLLVSEQHDTRNEDEDRNENQKECPRGVSVHGIVKNL